jgi:hypothetical protein
VISDTVSIRIFDVLGGPLAVSSDDGQVLHDSIAPMLRAGQGVELGFGGMEIMTPTFLNAAVGQLYGEFEHEEIRALLSVRDAGPDDIGLLKRVVENAKHYFANRAARVGAETAAPGHDQKEQKE